MSPSRDLTMMLVGDTFYIKGEGKGEDNGLLNVFDAVLPYFKKADVLYGNLEMPVTDKGEPQVGKPTGVPRRQRPRMMESYKRAGFDLMSLANNHTMDFGPDGLMDCIALADKAGIAHAGGGRNLKEARKPAIVSMNGYKIGLLSYTCLYYSTFTATDKTPGVATFKIHTAYEPPPRVLEQPGSPPVVITTPEKADVEALKKDIGDLRKKADIVVVSWHWGVSQGYRNIVDYQKALGRVCVDSGADIVVGHHPHVLQGVEVYKGRLIAYSLGDFVGYLPTRASLKFLDRETAILECRFSGKGLEQAAIVPIVADKHWYPNVVTGALARRVLGNMERDCLELGTRLRVADDQAEILLK